MTNEKRDIIQDALAKVPAITLGFWIIKIFATTLGETGGDLVSMSWLGETTKHPLFPNHWGYVVATIGFAAALIALIIAQIRASRFNSALYWATIVASTTAGTTLADLCTRFLGEGTVASYLLGSIILLICVLGALFAWKRTLGTVSVESVRTPAAEWFYWITITFSQTLGTALGDWLAGTKINGVEIGFMNGALVFGAGLAIVALLWFRSNISKAGPFWAAFVLTRPLGATLGDLLDKAQDKGGFQLDRGLLSLLLLGIIIVCLFIFPQRAAKAGEGH